MHDITMTLRLTYGYDGSRAGKRLWRYIAGEVPVRFFTCSYWMQTPFDKRKESFLCAF